LGFSLFVLHMGNRRTVTLRQYLRGWLQLLRLPNLLTVPGDPLAGAALHALACGQPPEPARLGLGVLAAFGFYCGGLLLNDLVDLPIDTILRPERPLPHQTVPVEQAALAMILAFGGALGAAFSLGFHAGATGLALLACIFAYTLVGKPLGGAAAALSMGLCRGLSVMLLAPVAGWGSWPAWLAVAVTLYVAGLTAVSLKENRSAHVGGLAWLPLAGAALHGAVFAMVAFAHAVSLWLPGVAAALAILTLAVALLADASRRLHGQGPRSPQETRRGVARFIHLLPLLQSWPLLLEPSLAGLGLLIALGAPLAMAAGRRYAGS